VLWAQDTNGDGALTIDEMIRVCPREPAASVAEYVRVLRRGKVSERARGGAAASSHLPPVRRCAPQDGPMPYAEFLAIMLPPSASYKLVKGAPTVAF
jgi:hypothetical protein